MRSQQDLKSLSLITSHLIEQIIVESDALKTVDERGRAGGEGNESRMELLSHIHAIVVENGAFRKGLNDLYLLLSSLN